MSVFTTSHREERAELLRQWNSLREDRNEITDTLEQLHDELETCTESREDSLNAEIDAKRELYFELAMKGDEIMAKIHAIPY